MLIDILTCIILGVIAYWLVMIAWLGGRYLFWGVWAAAIWILTELNLRRFDG